MATVFGLKRIAVLGAGVGAVTTSVMGYCQGFSEVRARNWHSNVDMKYPAGANYPDLSRHNNYMAEALTPAVSNFTFKFNCVPSNDTIQRGEGGDTRAVPINSFLFMRFSGKIGKIIG